MKNYVQKGDTITVSAPYAVTAGQGVLVGTLFGVASFSAANGATVEIVTDGVFDLAKADSQAWTVGALIYWDNAGRVCTTTSAGNTLIGKATQAVASSAGLVIGQVRLG